MRRAQLALPALLLLLASSGAALLVPAFAEELTVQAQVDKTEAAPGEKVIFSVKVTGSIRQSPELELGEMKGFRVLSSDQAQQIEVKGGHMRQTFVLTYLLTAAVPGKHVIGPVRVRVGAKVYSTQPIEIQVTEGPAPSRTPELEGGITL